MQPRQNPGYAYGLKKLETSLHLTVGNCDTLNRIGVAHECDRKTDRQTDRQTERSLATARRNRLKLHRLRVFHLNFKISKNTEWPFSSAL